jgi:protein SCO1/2
MRDKRTMTVAQIAALFVTLSASSAAAYDAGMPMKGAMQGKPTSGSMQGMQSMPAPQPIPGMSVYNLTSKWTTQDGISTDLASLRGNVVVAAMVYTHCRDVCPLTTERMQEIERTLPKSSAANARFALFSMDWMRDTPEQLRQFASQHHLDMQRWTLFHGDEAAVREMAAALGVSFHRQANGDFQHSIAIFLLDKDGVVAAEEPDLSKPATALSAKAAQLLAKR